MTSMNQMISIRKAEAKDIKDIIEIMNDAFSKYKRSSGISGRVDALEESAEDILNEMKSKKILVAVINDYPVATLRISFDILCESAYISRLGVRCGYNNRGIGTMLLKYADEYIGQIGAKIVALHSAMDNAELIKFYTERGFHIETVTGDRGYRRAKLVKEYSPKSKCISNSGG